MGDKTEPTKPQNAAEQLAAAKLGEQEARYREWMGEFCSAGGVHDPAMRAAAKEELIKRFRDANTARAAFDFQQAAPDALHAVGARTVRPARRVGVPGGLSAQSGMSPEEVQADRERYRARLRELRLLDPAVHSVPGDLGPGHFGYRSDK